MDETFIGHRSSKYIVGRRANKVYKGWVWGTVSRITDTQPKKCFATVVNERDIITGMQFCERK